MHCVGCDTVVFSITDTSAQDNASVATEIKDSNRRLIHTLHTFSFVEKYAMFLQDSNF